MNRASTIGRAAYRDIAPYAPDRTPCRIDLSDNTNLWGMPPAARDALADFSAERYPSVYAADLKAAISRYTGLPAEMITTGCGSDDVLDSAMRAFSEPGMRIAFTEPTFAAIPLFARMNALEPAVVPFDGLPGSGARVIYLCSPNNPTGTLTPRSAIERLFADARADQVILLDEAYAEFAGENAIDLLRDFERLLITRTMSKAFGLAGLRIGYALGDSALIGEVEKSRGPYKVSAPAERAAVAALTDGSGWVEQHVSLAIANRERLAVELRARGLAPLPSAANFLFVPLAHATTIAVRMRAAGVAVRAFGDPDGLRITAGPWAMLEEALEVLDEARRSCA